MGFKKYEVLVRKNSPVPLDKVIEMFKTEINNIQNENPNEYWAAHIFDLRSLKEFMIFSDVSKEVFDIEGSDYITKEGNVISAVMNLGEKILDVNKTLNEKFDENFEKKVPELENKIQDNVKDLIDKSIKDNINDNLKDIIKNINLDDIPKLRETLNAIHQKIDEVQKNLLAQILNIDESKISNDLIKQLENLEDIDDEDLKKLLNDLSNTKGFTI